MKSFSDLGLIEPLRRAVVAEGYTTPTPIQSQSIIPAISGRDVIGVAQTGTGKTAAFVLPVLQRMTLSQQQRVERNRPRALIVTPTRELAIQIAQSVKTYGRFLELRHAAVFGGVSQHPQVRTMRQGVDILAATPGRLLDLINQGHIRLDRIETLVLDEADRMLDMGFIHDIRKIVRKTPDDRQTLFFSATMPNSIRRLTREILENPVRIEIAPTVTTAERVTQTVMFVDRNRKRDLLQQLFSDRAMERAIVFTRTKRGANRLAKYLGQNGIKSDAIHGNKSQNARQKALTRFKQGHVKALVATNVASRGIDVDDVTHVVNFDLPNEPESYVHRIGRTGRAGLDGVALSFCDTTEVGYLKDIERTIKEKVDVDGDHGFHCDRTEGAYERACGGGGRGGSRRRSGRKSGGRGRNRSRTRRGQAR